jgi:hypothetical protein
MLCSRFCGDRRVCFLIIGALVAVVHAIDSAALRPVLWWCFSGPTRMHISSKHPPDFQLTWNFPSLLAKIEWLDPAFLLFYHFLSLFSPENYSGYCCNHRIRFKLLLRELTYRSKPPISKA